MLEKKIYKVNIEFSDCAAVSYNSIYMPSDDEKIVSFGRIDENEVPVGGGMLRIDGEKGVIGFVYDIFVATMAIKAKKEIDGNYFFECASDLFPAVRIYVVEYDTWVKRGPAYFASVQ